MKKYFILPSIVISLLISGCGIVNNTTSSAETSSELYTSGAVYTDKQKAAIEVGEYFLDNFENEVFSKDIKYHFNFPDERAFHINADIVEECEKNSFMWVAYFDEHTVVIYEPPFAHNAKGYLVTDGSTPKNVSSKSEQFGFDPYTMKITETISDKLYRYSAGL